MKKEKVQSAVDPAFVLGPIEEGADSDEEEIPLRKKIKKIHEQQTNSALMAAQAVRGVAALPDACLVELLREASALEVLPAAEVAELRHVAAWRGVPL